MDKIQVRMLIRKYFMEGVSATDAFKRIRGQVGDVTSKNMVFDWFRRFKSEGVGDVKDKIRLGRPLAIDLDKFKDWVISNPRQPRIAMRRQFKCSKNSIDRAIKSLKLIEVNGVWIVPVAAETEEQRPTYKTEVVKNELTLEQKIFIVANYYESGRKYDKILDEFEKKFNIGSIESLEDISMTVVQMFESAGSVTDSASYYIRQKTVIKKEQISSDDEEDTAGDDGEETIIKPSKFKKQKIKRECEELKIRDPPKKRVQDTTNKVLTSLYPKQCTICEKYISPYNFNNHMRTHGDERPYQCKVCHMTFKLNKYLLQHKKKHIPVDQRPVLICQICGEQTTSREVHMRHMKTHEKNMNNSESCLSFNSAFESHLFNK